MTKPFNIYIATLLLLSIIYFSSDQQNILINSIENEYTEFAANAEFDLLRTADPETGKIPSGAVMKAFNELKSRGYYQSNIDQLKTDDIYFGWQQIDDFFPSLSITKITYDPNSPETFYFCTGEGWYNADAVKGAGIFKSLDGGETWFQLASTDTLTFDYCQDIVVQPTTGDVFVATRTGGLMRSQDGGLSWVKVLGFGAGAGKNTICDIELTADGGLFVSIGIFETDGIYYSPTGDAGTFVKQTTGLPISGYFRIEIATAPSNPDFVYAIYCNNSDYKIKGIYKTTDKGNNWIEINTPENNFDFAAKQAWYDLSMGVDPNNENVVAIGGLHIWRTRDGGDSWDRMSAGGLDSVLIRYVHVDQHEVTFKNSDEVYFGNDGGVWKCMNFTAEQPFIYDRNAGYNVTQFYSVAIHPFENVPQIMGGTQDNGTPYAYDDGIAEFKSVSGGDGAFTAFNSINPEIFYTASQLTRIFRLDNGGFEIPDTITNPNLLTTNVLFINPFDLDASDPEVLFQCSNKGLWRLKNASIADTNDWAKAANISGPLTAIATSANAPGIAFIGKSSSLGDIYRLENAYESNELTIPVNADPNDFLPDGGFTSTIYCSSIVADQNNANHVIITYSNYNVESIWASDNALAAEPVWSNIEGNIPDIPVYWSAIHPMFENIIYVATELGVFYTDNANGDLTNWIPCSSFPIVRTDMLRIRNNDFTIAAATHGRGIWQAALDPLGFNNDIAWIERGPVNVGGRTRTIMIDPNDPTSQTIWAGSVAGGLWKTTTIDASPVEQTSIGELEMTIYPNPASQEIHISFNVIVNQQVKIDLIDLKGKRVATILNKNISGEQLLYYHLPAYVSKGIYFIVIKTANSQAVRKLIVS